MGLGEHMGGCASWWIFDLSTLCFWFCDCVCIYVYSLSQFFRLCSSSVAKLCFGFCAQEVLRMWQWSRRPESDPPTRQRNRKWAVSCMSTPVCVSLLAWAASVAAHCGQDRLMRSSYRKCRERREENIKTTGSARDTRFSFFFMFFFFLHPLPSTCISWTLSWCIFRI